MINRIVGANLEPESFDLVLCIGVLAHVDSPATVIAEIERIAKPGASVILEFTDSFHSWSVPVVVYQRLLASVQESDRARDFSGFGFTVKTDAVAVVALGMWKPRVWCGFPSSVGRTTTLR